MTPLELAARTVDLLFGPLDPRIGDHLIGMALDRPRRRCDCAECEAMRERDARLDAEERRDDDCS